PNRLVNPHDRHSCCRLPARSCPCTLGPRKNNFTFSHCTWPQMYYYPLSSLRAATISLGVFRITLSVSEGTGFRPNRPLADAQGYSPPRNATNGLRLAAMRGRLQPAAGFSPPKSANLAEIFGQWGTPPLCKEQPLVCDISAPRQSPARAGDCRGAEM